MPLGTKWPLTRAPSTFSTTTPLRTPLQALTEPSLQCIGHRSSGIWLPKCRSIKFSHRQPQRFVPLRTSFRWYQRPPSKAQTGSKRSSTHKPQSDTRSRRPSQQGRHEDAKDYRVAFVSWLFPEISILTVFTPLLIFPMWWLWDFRERHLKAHRKWECACAAGLMVVGAIGSITDNIIRLGSVIGRLPAGWNSVARASKIVHYGMIAIIVVTLPWTIRLVKRHHREHKHEN